MRLKGEQGARPKFQLVNETLVGAYQRHGWTVADEDETKKYTSQFEKK